MHLPPLRRRFIWPADDLVTLRVPIDKAIDVALWWVPGHRPMDRLSAYDPTTTVSVLGFPRSANTLLTLWLNRVVREGVMVLDGRNSHSALDLRRQVDAGIRVLVPVRDPVDACASMLVRQARHDSPSAARGMLRAYAAWHTVVGEVMERPNMSVATFEQVTSDLGSVGDRPILRPLIDPQLSAAYDSETLIDSARKELATVVGQGLPQDGIPAHYMISLPDPAREPQLEQARHLLSVAALAKERDSAYEVFADFRAAAAANS